MLRPTKLANKWQKRLIRPLYAQTQAYPYAATLDPSLYTTDNVFVPPTTSNDSLQARSADVALYKGGLIPGTVMVKGAAEGVLVHAGVSTQKAFGLLANFVGGELDDLQGEVFVGVWRGPDSVFEILAPGFNDSGLATAYSNATPGVPAPLYAGTDGLLTGTDPGSGQVVGYLIERPTATRIVVDLKV